MTKYAVVTTFNQSGYDKYASRMIDTFLKTWPGEVDLYVYTEDCEITQTARNLHVRNLYEVSPGIVAFKQRWGSDPRARGEVHRSYRCQRQSTGHGIPLGCHTLQSQSL